MLVSQIFFQKLYISKMVEECYVYSKIKKGERRGIITYNLFGEFGFLGRPNYWVQVFMCSPYFQTFNQDLRV
jgi:hypothetical protein